MTPTQPPRASSWWTLAVLLGVIWGGFQALQWWQAQQQSQALADVLRRQPVLASDVLMYTTSTCPYCAQARNWLSQNRVPFTECNVERESPCLAEYERQGAPGVPLMQVRGAWHLGFDAQWVVLVLQRQADNPSAAKSPRP